MASTPFRIALSTASSEEEARRIARHLVEQGLAACVNIVPGLTSIYRWQGAVETAHEVLLLVKTTGASLGALEEALCSLHSYEVPEFVVLGVDGGSAAYLEWLAASVTR
ncbi:divalent-cation tolerance protein CutA [Silvibacterium dinghuense]|uniref:Divalent-cation tolerance protein CutA n=1 Tax=Silvibacterium dinghuense TaxID=1560006 RepID=A0A4Q1S875_9BACT|nr:divalent-cation tolerance protein CutA [Silvibacterium dinghuense]RXS93085.1 divalent-cation tolerance protein CutA [Silvibacterium dinghuense]